ncbi:dockerin type I domain-containing protein [uncultured Ruminococcus sp.]|uniref:dockerin type I domain-containing protein n=1 Tax=uncultured Ruminococcus sp. TaxID=165186 RepID=UPI0025E0DDE8|nr:dockerin type I domain-containing protein [uncultured Ruminococcus sp.]
MKHQKMMSVLLAAAISASAVLPASTYAISKGDINNDSVISADDLTLLQNYVLGKAELDKSQSELADINGDGAVNSYDISALRKLILASPRSLKFKAVTDRVQSGFTDALKKLDIQAGGTVVKSSDELKKALSPYFSETVVKGYTDKYNDTFFKDSVLMVKPAYFDPDKYQIKTAVTKAPCGCTSEKAGIYVPSAAVTEYMNIRKEHDYNSASLGKILPGQKFTITYSDGKYGHVNINGVSGYVNMDYVTKVSDLEAKYTAIPDVKINSVNYKDGKVTVDAAQFHSSAPIDFAAAVIVQAVVARKDYYASQTNWTVSTTAPPPTTTVTTTTYSYPLAKERLDKIGWDLKKAFNDAASTPYYGPADFPKDDKTTMQWYADYGFKNGKGNCYVMAAMFCEMAKLLGYDAHQISGRVPLKAGGYGPHSWVEITFEGTTYVCDPDFTEETKRNGYMITYGQSGTWVYQKDSVMS